MKHFLVELSCLINWFVSERTNMLQCRNWESYCA